MISASEVKEGMVLKMEDGFYKVITSEYKAGTAKFGSLVHLKLKNLQTGSFTERRFSPDDKLQAVHLEIVEMEYLYNDGENFYFMHPETYEQFSLSKKIIGDFAIFLKEGFKIKVEFYEGRPIDFIMPKTVDLRVIETGAGVKSETDAAYKTAKLENGLEIMVPQFIKINDIVRISTETKKYIERVK
ncbi:MAG: elongation factor P [candidate division WOR-3 bacterium]